MKIRVLNPATDMTAWLRMRKVLYEDEDDAGHLAEMQQIVNEPDAWGVLVAERPSERPSERPPAALAGFVEVGVRKYAEGITHAPVAYLEGWYVDADVRRQGLGRRLVAAAESWARENGYREMASDTTIDNHVSLAAHLALGYEEVERQICFIKQL